MTLIDSSTTVNEYGTLIKTETYELHNVEGFRVYGKLEVYENCSSYFVDIFKGEGSAVCTPVLGRHSYNSDHEKSSRQELKKCLRSKTLKIFCKKLAAEYETE